LGKADQPDAAFSDYAARAFGQKLAPHRRSGGSADSQPDPWADSTPLSHALTRKGPEALEALGMVWVGGLVSVRIMSNHAHAGTPVIDYWVVIKLMGRRLSPGIGPLGSWLHQSGCCGAEIGIEEG
jgi:hypothetical protein